MSIALYHGSTMLVEFPEIRKTKYKKDFSWGFYCTKDYQQAARWASKKSDRNYQSFVAGTGLSCLCRK